MASIQYRHKDVLLNDATDIFFELMRDREGREKYEGFLVAATEKLAAVERSIRKLQASGEVFSEVDFASRLSNARRMLEVCLAGGWFGFTRHGTGCFGSAVNLDITLRSFESSLGIYMSYEPIEPKPETPVS
jgi:hypothetical protein